MMELFERKILERIGREILKSKQTIAVAESVTSGLIQFAFSTIPDAAAFFQGGVTAYNVAQKFLHLNVEPIHATAVNCVSQRVADEMAEEVCDRFRSDWGLGITGYATPVPESGHKLFAYHSIYFRGKRLSIGKFIPGKMEPKEAQVYYVNTIMRKLHSHF